MNFEKFTDKSQNFISIAYQYALKNSHQHILPNHLLKIFINESKNGNLDILEIPSINLDYLESSNDKILNNIPSVIGENINIFFSDKTLKLLNQSILNLQEFFDKHVYPELILYSMFDSCEENNLEILKKAGITKKKVKDYIIEQKKSDRIVTTKMSETKNLLEKFSTNLTSLAKKGKLDPVIGREEEIRRSIQVLSRRTKNNPVLIGEPGVGKTAIVEGLANRIVDKDIPESLRNKEILSIDMGAIVAGAKFRGEFEDRLKSILKAVSEKSDEIILFIDEIHTIVGAGRAEGSMDASNILKPALARGELHCIGATTLNEYRENIEKDTALARRFQQVIVSEPSLDDSISILRGLKEKYEVHHGVRIRDSALVSAVELSKRYINDRFLPDKAIDLMDEAASRIRIQVDSKPEELDKIERKILQNKIELESLKKENDKKSMEKVEKINSTLKDLESSFRNLNNQWLKEKEKILDIQKLKTEIDNHKSELEILKRGGKLAEASELSYGKIPSLEKKLEDLEKNTSKKEIFKLLTESVSSEDIAFIVSKWTGIPVNRLIEGEKKRLLEMENELKKMVIGQNQAIESISSAVKRSATGINDPSKPVGVFMFLGPTGVGKTELTRALAKFLFSDKNSMLRIDMSEYMEKHSVSRLIGAPPGYVGFENAGYLTEAVRRKPYQIILFDEIEKANVEIFNLLLQVFDDGRLTDGQGRTINFKNTLIIMTSNIGGDLMSTNENDELDVYTKEKILQQVKDFFKPEFLNRIDDIILFNKLDKKNINEIIEIQLIELKKLMKKNKVRLEIDNKAKEWLASEGFLPQYGARPLKRIIQKNIKNKVADIVLKSNSNDEINVKVTTNEDGLLFK